MIHTARIAGRDLIGHAFRSALTALGVVFGVGAVVAMMAISEGARRESLAQIEARGIDNIVVRSVRPVAGQQVTQGRAWTALEYGIKDRDIRHIREVFDNIRIVVPVRDARKAIYVDGLRTDIRVLATTPEFPEMTRSRLSDPRGRFLTDLDDKRNKPVCVLGVEAARKIFGYHDPINQTVNIDGIPFRAVGLLDNPFDLKLADGFPIENMVYVPLGAAESLFGKTARERSAGSMQSTKVDCDFLYIKVLDKEQIENTAARLRTYLHDVHGNDDWSVLVPYELLKQKEAQQRIFTIVMASIAAISLLVGGIGIMNIMMANIYERTKEIGTRRALGAKKRDVLLQFLSEAVLLTVLGGLVGVGVGWGLAAGVRHFSGMPTEVTAVSVVISLGVSVLVGLVFGTYPAWKAANLDPIVALRTE